MRRKVSVRTGEVIRVPESWSELREALRDLNPKKRNYGIALVYENECPWCGQWYQALSPRKDYCPGRCEEYASNAIKQQEGIFRKAMLWKRKNDRRKLNEKCLEKLKQLQTMVQHNGEHLLEKQLKPHFGKYAPDMGRVLERFAEGYSPEEILTSLEEERPGLKQKIASWRMT